MIDKIEEIRARNSRDDRWRNTQSNEDRGWLLAEVDRQRAEIKRLREALSWYADPRNHFHVKRRSPGDPDPAVVFVDEPAIMTDWGRRARKALGGEA